MLLTASCIFYMYFIPKYIFILFLTILIDYAAGIAMEKYPDRKKTFLIASLIGNIGILFFFKYFNFFIGNINHVAQLLHWNYSLESLKIILPIGLSFHTFQAMSYTIEVYRGNQKAERHPGIYALYVMYYPQLVAGPIERPQNLLHQFHTNHKFNFERFQSGLRLILWGFFKKLVIADRLSHFVNLAYDNPVPLPTISIFVACVFFSIQIYCDFSGYSDIARGASRIMGIELMENFRMPYFSKNINEFWSRWHISLSTWFKDYLYIPLGGNWVSKKKWLRNLMIVFLISGLWHGASWTFISWGALHGVLTILTVLMVPYFFKLNSNKIWKLISVLFTFYSVTAIWIFFRAENFSKAAFMLKAYLAGIPGYIHHVLFQPGYLWLEPFMLNLDFKKNGFDFIVIAVSVSALFISEYIFFKKSTKEKFETSPAMLKSFLYCTLILFILFTGTFHNNTEFIYFQF
jgi:alginate O-acetyltransferase complex protein AlgI